jgi:hypothetical protein
MGSYGSTADRLGVAPAFTSARWREREGGCDVNGSGASYGASRK